jgi:hypothetical protein
VLQVAEQHPSAGGREPDRILEPYARRLRLLAGWRHENLDERERAAE